MADGSVVSGGILRGECKTEQSRWAEMVVNSTKPNKRFQKMWRSRRTGLTRSDEMWSATQLKMENFREANGHEMVKQKQMKSIPLNIEI